jgi:hypothetical protein
VEVGGRMVDLKPEIWNVMTPVDWKLPETVMLRVVGLVQTPLKLATCEHSNLTGTVKYEGIET